MAQWFVGRQDRLDRTKAAAFQEKLASAVSHEVEYNSDHGNSQRLGGDLVTVEEIAETLGRPFSEEIELLNEALSECGSTERDEDGEGWRSHQDSCASSIESIFDSLLE